MKIMIIIQNNNVELIEEFDNENNKVHYAFCKNELYYNSIKERFKNKVVKEVRCIKELSLIKITW